MKKDTEIMENFSTVVRMLESVLLTSYADNFFKFLVEFVPSLIVFFSAETEK